MSARKLAYLSVLVPVLTVLGSLAAWAYWTSAGIGTASASTGTLNAPTNVVASNTTGTGAVQVSWTASAPTASGLVPSGYYVTRVRNSDSATFNACGSSAVSPTASSPCTDNAVADGTYHYVVTGVKASWTAISPSSNNVTVFNDVIPPAVTINQALGQADPTNSGTVVFTAVFSEPVTGFTNAGVATAGTAGGTRTVSVTGSGSSYTVTVSGATGNGTIAATVPAGGALDVENNGNTVSTSTDNTVTLDTAVPTVSSIVRAGPSAAVKAGPLSWTVTFSEPVSGVATSNFALVTASTGGTPPALTTAVAVGASPAAQWTVSSTEAGTTGTNSGSIGLNLSSVGAVVDVATNGLSAALPVAGAVYAFDTVAPTVSSILRVGSAVANAGPLSWTVTFSEPVSGVATSNFALVTANTAGTAPALTTAVAVGASPASQWTVSSTEAGTTGTNSGSIGLNLSSVGSVVDVATNGLSAALPVAGAVYAFDTAVSTVTNVTSATVNGTYGVGTVIPVTLAFSESVTVTGTPQLTLETGVTDRVVNYTSGSPGATLTFNYTVQAGDTSSDLTYVGTTSLALNGGTIKDAAGNNATLTLAAPAAAGSLGANKAIVIETIAPTVTVTSVNGLPRTFPYLTNANVASFGGACGTAAGDIATVSPLIAGAATVPATTTCSGGAWTLTLTTPLATDGIRALSATQPDAAGNVGTATPRTLTIDKTAPTVTNVTSTTADGAYRAGAVIPVTVTFSEAVVVSGTPRLTLTTGSPATTAVNYTSGTGTSVLTFNYTIAAGNTSPDLDYAANSSLALNGGTIRDAATNNATLSLAAPGAAGSLAFNKAIVIDTTAPTVTINKAGGQADPTNSGTVVFTAVFSEPVTGFAAGDVTIGGTSGGTKTAVITGTGPTYTITVSGATGNGTITATIAAGTVQDLAGNNNTASTSADNSITLDTTAPTVTNVALANGTGGGAGTPGRADERDTVTITYSEAMDASKFCSTWVNNTGARQQLSGPSVTVTITDNGTNDVLTVVPTGCPGFVVGSVALGANYVTTTTTFSGTTNGRVRLDATGTVVSIRLGAGSGSQTGVGNSNPVYTPASGLTDLAGNALATTAWTGGSSRF